jgi:hypothetical protein
MIRSSCRICNSAAESISICNAKKTAYIFNISGKMKFRITNANIHGCRIANSAVRRRRPRSAQTPACAATPARRRLQPTSDIKAKLQLCSLGYAERKIPSGENQNRYLMLFDDRHGFTALQAVQSGSFAVSCDVGWSLRRAGARNSILREGNSILREGNSILREGNSILREGNSTL